MAALRQVLMPCRQLEKFYLCESSSPRGNFETSDASRTEKLPAFCSRDASWDFRLPPMRSQRGAVQECEMFPLVG